MLRVSTIGASCVAQWKRIHLPVQEMQVWSLGREDPLEEKMATHSSILAWKIPWTEETGGLQSTGSQRIGHDCVTKWQQYLKTSQIRLVVVLNSMILKYCIIKYVNIWKICISQWVKFLQMANVWCYKIMHGEEIHSKGKIKPMDFNPSEC